MQFSELVRDAVRQLSVSCNFIILWLLCILNELRDVKSNNNISSFAVFLLFMAR